MVQTGSLWCPCPRNYSVWERVNVSGSRHWLVWPSPFSASPDCMCVVYYIENIRGNAHPPFSISLLVSISHAFRVCCAHYTKSSCKCKVKPLQMLIDPRRHRPVVNTPSQNPLYKLADIYINQARNGERLNVRNKKKCCVKFACSLCRFTLYTAYTTVKRPSGRYPTISPLGGQRYYRTFPAAAATEKFLCVFITRNNHCISHFFQSHSYTLFLLYILVYFFCTSPLLLYEIKKNWFHQFVI